MNKAFLRDPDDASERCPRCGTPGIPVVRTTLDAWIAAERRQALGDFAAFCPRPACAVAYFDQFDRYVEIAALVRPPWPKDPAAPLCACFGLTAAEIEADVDEGGVTRTRAAVERAKSPEARCQEAAADGQSCVPAVQSYYFQCRQTRGSR